MTNRKSYATFLLVSISLFPAHALAAQSKDRAQTLAAQVERAEENQASQTVADASQQADRDPDYGIKFEGRKNAQENAAKLSSVVAEGGPLDRQASGTSAKKGLGVSNFELATSDNRVVANLAFGYVFNDATEKKLKDSNRDYNFVGESFRLSAKVSVPVNGKDARQFADFKRIGDDSKLTFSAVYFRSSHNDGDTNRRVKNLAYGACVLQAGRSWAKETNSNLSRTTREQVADAFYQNFLSLVMKDENQTGDAAIETAAESSSDFGKKAIDACVPGGGVMNDELTLLQRYGAVALGDDPYRQFHRRFIKPNNLLFLGVDVTAGYERYDVLNRTAFRTDIVDRVGFDATIFGGFIGASGNTSFKVSGGYARGYKTQAEAELCRATAVAGETQCFKGQDGLPKREDKAYVKSEYRLVLARDDRGLPRVAVAPEVTYDFKGKDWVIDVPIYLQRSKESGLDGGIRIGYETGDDDFGVGVFVGIPFSTWF